MTVDFFSLLLQAVGGGLAGAAFSRNTSPWPGTYTMVSGTIWQLVSACVFATLLEYAIFRGRNCILQNLALRLTSISTMIAVTCMVACGVYRSMELMDGWRGYLFTYETFAIVLDASLMFIASLVFVIWHPAILILQAKEFVSRRPLTQEALELRQGDKTN